MRYTLRQLAIFLAVARHQNISKAAAELHMSQSAASEALLKLENTYHLELFDRSKNSLLLTSVGESLRKEAEGVLASCQKLEQSLRGHKSIGHLRVAASFTIGNHLVTRYLAGYLQDFPEADVQLEVANTPEVAAKILNYEADIGMIEGEVQNRDLELIPWIKDELVVFCAADHPLAREGKLTAQDARSVNWILREPESGARHTLDRALEGLLPTMNIYLELKHNEAIKNAVETGLGIGCLSRIVLQKNFENGDLVPLALPRRDMSRTLYFALPKQRAQSDAVQHWMDICTH
ncbi:MAG: LysR substrate-binding domain-containing protein [Pseudomonadales bacterium]